MQLKTYQQNTLEQLDRWLDALKETRLKAEKLPPLRMKHPDKVKTFFRVLIKTTPMKSPTTFWRVCKEPA